MRFCPVCKEVLINTLREGVEIDYCPKCRGVWLDRNELEKIIERVSKRQTTVANAGKTPAKSSKTKQEKVAHHPVQVYPTPHHKADDSYLEEIFDFDD